MVYTKKPVTFDDDGPLGLCAVAGLEPLCKFLIVEAPLGGSGTWRCSRWMIRLNELL